VSKISHDLRNILSSAQLLSDRLGTVNDPRVQALVPKLIASLDRAIRLCAHTLDFGQAQETPPNRQRFPLRPLLGEVGESLGLPRPNMIGWELDIDPGLEIDADRDQLYRVLSNLARNALQALDSDEGGSGCGEIMVLARKEGGVIQIEVSDTGPGVPERARAHLFKAFQGAARKGGTGLGLAIAAEIVQAHGGQIALIRNDGGATFRVTIPDVVVDLARARRRSA
jgi:signal transduction histidine kinase